MNLTSCPDNGMMYEGFDGSLVPLFGDCCQIGVFVVIAHYSLLGTFRFHTGEDILYAHRH